jgi:hypothetical protein
MGPDKYFPQVCDIFSLQSRVLPALEVFKATGALCPSFKEKAA